MKFKIMHKLILTICFLAFAVPGWATDYYVKNAGDDAKDGLSDANAWKTVAKVEAESLAGTFNAGDNIYFNKGDEWRERLDVWEGGTSGNPITFGSYGTGANPLVNGSDLYISWTEESSNIWYASATIVQIVLFDDTFGDEKADKPSLVDEYDWWWDSGNSRLYVYSTSDPNTAYTSPGVEATKRDACLAVVGDYDYVTFDGIDTTMAVSFGNVFENGADYGTVKNSTHTYCNLQGVRVQANSTASNYFTMDNVTMHDNMTAGISIHDSSNYTITNSTAYDNDLEGGTGWKGFNLDGTSNGLIEDCVAYNEYFAFNLHTDDNTTLRRIKGYDSVTGLGIFYGSTRITVEDSEFYNNSNENVDIWSTTGNTSGITIKRTISYDAAAGQSGFRQGGNTDTVYGATKFEYSLSWDNGGSGFEILAGEAQFRGVVAYNNTKSGIYTDQANTVIKNSFASENGEYAFRFQGAGGTTGVDSDYNDLHEGGGLFTAYWNDTAYGDLSTYKSASSQDANSIESDPSFTTPATHDFTLQSSSPAIDVGTDLGATYDDALDTSSSWPSSVTTQDQDLHGNDWEIGAYVYETIWRWGD